MRWSLFSSVLLSVCLFSMVHASPSDEDFKTGKQAYLEKRYPEAFHHFSKAADNNHAEAMLWLGTMYSGDQFGLKKDRSKVFAWYEKAAENGNARPLIA